MFDEADIEFLEKFKVPAYKISSFESYYPLIEKVLNKKTNSYFNWSNTLKRVR